MQALTYFSSWESVCTSAQPWCLLLSLSTHSSDPALFNAKSDPALFNAKSVVSGRLPDMR